MFEASRLYFLALVLPLFVACSTPAYYSLQDDDWAKGEAERCEAGEYHSCMVVAYRLRTGNKLVSGTTPEERGEAMIAAAAPWCRKGSPEACMLAGLGAGFAKKPDEHRRQFQSDEDTACNACDQGRGPAELCPKSAKDAPCAISRPRRGEKKAVD